MIVVSDKYKVELFYGYEEHEQGIFHAFDAVMPQANVDDDAIVAKLAEQLDCTLEDDRFNWNSMYISLPEELVAKIKADAVKEYKDNAKIAWLKQEIAWARADLEDAQVCSPEVVPFYKRELDKWTKQLDEFMAGLSVDDVLEGAIARSAETGRADAGKEDFVKE